MREAICVNGQFVCVHVCKDWWLLSLMVPWNNIHDVPWSSASSMVSFCLPQTFMNVYTTVSVGRLILGQLVCNSTKKNLSITHTAKQKMKLLMKLRLLTSPFAHMLLPCKANASGQRGLDSTAWPPWIIHSVSSFETTRETAWRKHHENSSLVMF